MASGPGKNQDGNQTKEPAEREESNSAAAAAAAEPPPPAPPSDRLQEQAHGSPESGDRNPSATTAAEAATAAQRKGKGIGAPSWRHDAGGKPPLPPQAASVSRANEPKPAAGKPPLPPRASESKDKKPMSDAEVVKSGMDVRNKWKDMRKERMHMKKVFEELLEESKANAEMDQEDEPEGTAMQLEQVKYENYYKGSIWRKILDRIGISDLNSRIVNPEVNYEQMGRRRGTSRRLKLFFIILLLFAFLPTGTAFRQFDTVEDAANMLAVLPYVNLDDIRNRLQEEEAPTTGFSFGLQLLLIAFGALLVGSLALSFVDPGQEPAPAVEGRPQEINTDSTAALVMLAVTLVTVVVVVFRFLGGR